MRIHIDCWNFFLQEKEKVPQDAIVLGFTNGTQLLSFVLFLFAQPSAAPAPRVV